MRERLQQRLRELEQDFAMGQKQLTELEEQANALRTTLLRISGAIQALRELDEASTQDEQDKPELGARQNGHAAAIDAGA